MYRPAGSLREGGLVPHTLRSLVDCLMLGYPVVNESCGRMMGRGKMGGESWVTYFLWLDRLACSLRV